MDGDGTPPEKQISDNDTRHYKFTKFGDDTEIEF
jgi:hypothetical protein